MNAQPSHRKSTDILSSRGPLFGRRRRRCIAASPGAERLEDRALLSTIFWKGGNGDWSSGSKWIGGTVPGPTDTAVIQDSNITITHDSSHADSAHEVDFLGTGSLLSVTAGQLNVGSLLNADGNDLEQSGGSFSAGQVQVDSLALSGGSFTGGVQVDSLALSGGSCSVSNGLVGSFTFSEGTFTVGGELTVTGPMDWTGSSIVGGGAVGGGTVIARGGLTLGGTAPNTSYLLTLGPNVTLVNQGQAVMQQVTGGSFSTQLILSSVFPLTDAIPGTFDNQSRFDFQGDNTIINHDNFTRRDPRHLPQQGTGDQVRRDVTRIPERRRRHI